ncbi:MAG TPA: hypothetical protein VNP04_22310 [Alphaproteobacteria bacterium]|nr:hypothetical protein [Alphaproteobacteria bacterium]
MRDKRTAIVMTVPTYPKLPVSTGRAWPPLSFRHRRFVRNMGACLGVAIYPSFDALKTISVILSLILANTSLVWSGSKYLFLPLEEKDFFFYLDKKEQTINANLYLYSSLSLLNLNKASVAFSISHQPFKHVSPLTVIDITPKNEFYIQSEFFDFTIWGQLGNFFNKEIEIIKIETEILQVLKEIEEINKKYKELLDAGLIFEIRSEKIITIDRMNFVKSIRGHNTERSDKRKLNPIQSKIDSSIIHMYESESRWERLRGDIQFRTGKREIMEPGFYSTTYVQSVNTSQKLEAEEPEIDSLLFRIFYNMVALIKYFQNNKVESFIYLSLLLLVTTFIKVLFTR